MKNLFTLIAAAGLTAGAWAATIFVPVEGPIDPLFKHTVTAPSGLEGYTLKGTQFINADGTKQSGTYHDLVDFQDGKLSYFDLSRLSNGYMLVYDDGQSAPAAKGEVIASYASGYVKWDGSNPSRINITPLLQKAFGADFKPADGDKIIVHADANKNGQLYWYDNGEVKITGSADTEKNKDGYQEACQDTDGSYYFDFVLSGNVLDNIKDRLPNEIYFTGDGYNVTKIEYYRASETTQLVDYSVSGRVNWSNGTRIDIVPLLKAKYGEDFVPSAGDKLYVHANCGSGGQGQLWWTDNDNKEVKFLASSGNGKNHSDSGYQEPLNDGNDYYFDFVFTDDNIGTITGRWPESIEFTGNDFDVTSIEYAKAGESASSVYATPATLTKTDEKIPTYADMPSGGTITSTSWETVATKTYDPVQSVCWDGGDGNIKNLNLTDDIKGITFSDEYRILIGVDGTTGEHGQLIWNDNGEKKYAYPDNGGSWGDGAYGGKDAKWSEQIDGKTYFVFELTAEMAAEINKRLAKDSETDVNFSAGGGSVKVASLTVQKKKVTTIEVGEYHAYNLWNAKDDQFIVDYGFDAGVWGFTKDGDGSAFANFNSWCENNDRYSIGDVEKYFEGEEGMAGQKEWQDPAKSLSPEYWAAVAPRFDAKLGDKVIVAIEPYYNQDDWGKDNCTMQVWNVKEEDGEFKANILTWDGAKPDTGNHDLAIYDNQRYDGDQLIWTFTLNTEEKVTQAKHGMRIKGRGFKVHRIDWIAQQQQMEEVNDGIFYIHVKPEVFKLHKDWEYANMSAEKFRPSVDKNKNHWNETVDGSNASHNFPETVDLHFYTDKQTNRSQVAMEYYAYLEDGSEYPIAQFIGNLTAGNDIPDSDKGFNNEYAPKQMEEFNERVATTLNIAGLERYTCSCGEYEDGHSHYLTKLWYKPLDKVIEALESNGLYMKVTVTKAAAGVNARRRAAAAAEAEVDPSGLTFKPSAKQNDQYIEYSLPEGSDEPALYFHRAGMQVSDLVITTGVNEIAAENEAPAEIYNLQGIRVAADDLTPGVYVVRQGDKTRKVVIR